MKFKNRKISWWIRYIYYNTITRSMSNYKNRRFVVKKWVEEGRNLESIKFAKRMKCTWIGLDCIEWAEEEIKKINKQSEIEI